MNKITRSTLSTGKIIAAGPGLVLEDGYRRAEEGRGRPGREPRGDWAALALTMGFHCSTNKTLSSGGPARLVWYHILEQLQRFGPICILQS